MAPRPCLYEAEVKGVLSCAFVLGRGPAPCYGLVRTTNHQTFQGTLMAVEPATTEPTGHEMEAHVRDYAGFTKMFKMGTIIVAIIALFILFIIS